MNTSAAVIPIEIAKDWERWAGVSNENEYLLWIRETWSGDSSIF